MGTTWMWLGLLGLGAVHGVNPGMGWLFAVGSALQRRDRSAVWRALGPLALGHALAIGAVLGIAAALNVVVPVLWLRWITAALLIGVGALHLTRHAHPRFGGMRMSGRELTAWSFLMASAHGAGLMALPLVLRAKAAGSAVASAVDMAAGPVHDAKGQVVHVGDAVGAAAQSVHGAVGHAGHGALHHGVLSAGLAGAPSVGLTATVVHTLGYLFATALIAWVVYEKLGVRFLRRAWVNVDLIWAVALIATGVLAAVL
jgi:hypothetical protein